MPRKPSYSEEQYNEVVSLLGEGIRLDEVIEITGLSAAVILGIKGRLRSGLPSPFADNTEEE